jgi:hypothetical protein
MEKNAIAKTGAEIVNDIPEDLRAHLSGEHALGIFKQDLIDAGLRLPEDYQFKLIDKKALQATHSAVFSLLGGVPAYLLWAHNNPDKFFTQWMKINPDATGSSMNIGIAGNGITITTGLPSTSLDDITLDGEGRIIDDGDDL